MIDKNHIVFDFTKYTDVALYKMAYQSSLSKWSSAWGARGVLQKDISHEFNFHTSLDDPNPWWYVDLRFAYPIDYIIVYDRIKYAKNSRTLTIEISQDLNSWSLIHKGLIYFNDEGYPLIIPLSGKVYARYVRLSLNESAGFHLKKVSVLVSNDRLSLIENLIDNSFPTKLPLSKRINIAILGTSNSIMEGYKVALSNLNCNIVKNVSVGSSHSSIIPFRLQEIESVDIDYLIIDIFVNESRALEQGFSLGNTTEEILSYLSYWCNERNVIPIILILPTKNKNLNFLNKKISWCLENKLFYINGFELIENFCNLYDRRYLDCFIDSAHLSKMIARILGLALNDCLLKHKLSEVRSQKSEVRSQKSEVRSQKSEVRRCYVIELCQHLPNVCLKKILRETSLISVEFIDMAIGDRLEVLLPAGSRIIGLVLNMAKANAVLCLKTKEATLLKNLSNDFYSKEKDLWLVVWNLQQPLEVVDGKLLLEIIDFNNQIIGSYESNDHISSNNANLVNYPISLELSGLIVQEPEKNMYENHISQNLSSLDLLYNSNYDILSEIWQC